MSNATSKVIPGISWDDFLKRFDYSSGQGKANIPGLGDISAIRQNADITGGGGEGGGPPPSDAYTYTQDYGNNGPGAYNAYVRGPNGELVRQDWNAAPASGLDKFVETAVPAFTLGGMGVVGGAALAGAGAFGGAGATGAGDLASAGYYPSPMEGISGGGLMNTGATMSMGAGAEVAPGAAAGAGGGMAGATTVPIAGAAAGGGAGLAEIAPWLAAATGAGGALANMANDPYAATAQQGAVNDAANAPTPTSRGGTDWLGILGKLGSAAGSILGGATGGPAQPSTAYGTPGPSWLNGLGQVIGGTLSASEQKDLGNQIINTVDPYHQYRSQAAANLNGMVNAPGYAGQFSPTALNNWTGNNNPLTSASMQNLNGFQANPALANSYGAMNALGAQNAGAYGALGGVGNAYASLLSDPGSIFQDKAYQAQLGQGTEALNRTLAARGQTNSGNEQQALQNYGEGQAAQYYGNRVNQLGQGYNQNLSALGQQFGQAQNTAGANLGLNAQQFGQTAQDAATNLQANQLGYNQLTGAFGANLQGNQANYGQMSQMAGLGWNPNLGMAGNALSNIYSNVGNAYKTGVGPGYGQILNNLGGSSGLFSAIGSGLGALGSIFGGGSSGAPTLLNSNDMSIGSSSTGSPVDYGSMLSNSFGNKAPSDWSSWISNNGSGGYW